VPRFNDEPDSCRWNTPEEVRLREYVNSVNAKHGVQMISVV
jgi:hypothetical protein